MLLGWSAWRLQLSVDRYGAFPRSLRIVEPLLAVI
jgi:hypothetical protein